MVSVDTHLCEQKKFGQRLSENLVTVITHQGSHLDLIPDTCYGLHEFFFSLGSSYTQQEIS